MTPEKLVKQLRGIVATATAYSPYYRSILAGYQIDSLQDFSRLPVLKPETVKKEGLNLLTVHPAHAYRIFATGGTTGNPKIVIHDRAFFQDGLAKVGKRVFSEMRVSKSHLFFNFLPFTGLAIGGPGSISMAESFGIASVGVGMDTSPELAVSLLQSFEAPKVFFVYPSHFVPFTEKLMKLAKLRSFNVTHIITGGEPLSDRTRSFLAEKWNAEVFLQYSSTEVGPIAWECPEHNGMHLIEESVHTEVIDTNSQANIEEGTGRVLVTSLYEKAMPFIRYAIGEIAQITRQPCRCGWDSPRIWIKGREDDLLFLAGAVKLFPADFSEAINAFPELSGIFQIEITKMRGKEDLLFRIETPLAQEARTEALKQKISERIAKVSPDLMEAIYQDGLINPPRVEFVSVGALERNKSGKLKHPVIDKRD